MVKNSTELDNILEVAEISANKFGTSFIGSEHIIYAMLNNDCVAGKILEDSGVNASEYNAYFDMIIDTSVQGIKGFTSQTKRMIESAADLAQEMYGENAIVGMAHLLAVILNCRDCLAMRIFRAINVNFDKILMALEKVL